MHSYQFVILNYSESHPITVEGDLKSIKKMFFKEFPRLSMVEEKIGYALHKAEIKKNFSVFSDYSVSERQAIYNNLTNNNFRWFYKEHNETELTQIVRNYSDNWGKVLTFANQFKNELFMNDENIEHILFNMFQKLDSAEKVTFLESMFKVSYQFEVITPNVFLKGLTRRQLQTIINFSPESENYKWQFAYLTELEEIEKEEVQLLESLLISKPLPKYFTVLDFEKYILVKPEFKEILIQKAEGGSFVIPYFIREEEVLRLINLIGEDDLKVLYLKELGNNIDHGCYLFQKLGEDDTDFTVEILKKIYELKMGYNNEVYMLLHTIKSFNDAEKIYLIFLNHTISKDPLYYYNGFLENIFQFINLF